MCLVSKSLPMPLTGPVNGSVPRKNAATRVIVDDGKGMLGLGCSLELGAPLTMRTMLKLDGVVWHGGL